MAHARTRSRILRVLVVDDSTLVCEFLRELIDEEPDMLVVGTAHNGADTLELVRKLKPDLITMDVTMPKMDGVAATRQIMANHPTPIAVVTSQPVGPDAPTTFNAIAAGAVDVFKKPSRTEFNQNPSLRDAFVRQLRNVGYVGVVGLRRPEVRPLERAGAVERPSSPPGPVRVDLRRDQPRIGSPRVESPRVDSPRAPAPRAEAPRVEGPRQAGQSPPPQASVPSSASLLAIGCSTGGPPTLRTVLSQLKPEQAPPVVVVQHMSKDFLQGFADWLGTVCPLPVQLAINEGLLRPGIVYVAPGDRHLTVSRKQMALIDSPPVQFQKPSADVLFQSVANSHDDNAIGVLLTGMGRDGADGLLAMNQRGACTIAQDEATSLVYGMPRAAAELGAASFSTSPEHIAALLSRVWHLGGG